MREKSEIPIQATTSLEETKEDGEILKDDKNIEEIRNQDICDVAETSKEIDKLHDMDVGLATSTNPENPCAKEMMISLPDDGKH